MWIAIGVYILLFVVFMIAVFTDAPEGYEDENGFHYGERETSNPPKNGEVNVKGERGKNEAA